ncbi:hypothetical protein FGO68_gene10756 [Halteria grandinella]|uniref:Uncharacterized protein n=1 Tax=Halteria grandinella TaxID=5974 RepID=A0A8J8N9B2_HALGN|nr:hypothetical protein FGO68_gene10756 [Halteria grandinella]
MEEIRDFLVPLNLSFEITTEEALLLSNLEILGYYCLPSTVLNQSRLSIRASLVNRFFLAYFSSSELSGESRLLVMKGLVILVGRTEGGEAYWWSLFCRLFRLYYLVTMSEGEGLGSRELASSNLL